MTGLRGPTGETGAKGILQGTADVPLGYEYVLDTSLLTYTRTTDVPLSRKIWGVAYEPNTSDTQNFEFVVSAVYYTGGSAGTWEAKMSIAVPDGSPPGMDGWQVGYTLHYSYQ